MNFDSDYERRVGKYELHRAREAEKRKRLEEKRAGAEQSEKFYSTETGKSPKGLFLFFFGIIFLSVLFQQDNTTQQKENKGFGTSQYKPTETEKTSADFGAYPKNYKMIVVSFFRKICEKNPKDDPEAFKYFFATSPEKARFEDELSGRMNFCWRIDFQVSHTNHSERKRGMALLKNGKVIAFLALERKCMALVRDDKIVGFRKLN